jgi:hypothetical protein
MSVYNNGLYNYSAQVIANQAVIESIGTDLTAITAQIDDLQQRMADFNRTIILENTLLVENLPTNQYAVLATANITEVGNYLGCITVTITSQDEPQDYLDGASIRIALDTGSTEYREIFRWDLASFSVVNEISSVLASVVFPFTAETVGDYDIEVRGDTITNGLIEVPVGVFQYIKLGA